MFDCEAEEWTWQRWIKGKPLLIAPCTALSVAYIQYSQTNLLWNYLEKASNEAEPRIATNINADLLKN